LAEDALPDAWPEAGRTFESHENAGSNGLYPCVFHERFQAWHQSFSNDGFIKKDDHLCDWERW